MTISGRFENICSDSYDFHQKLANHQSLLMPQHLKIICNACLFGMLLISMNSDQLTAQGNQQVLIARAKHDVSIAAQEAGIVTKLKIETGKKVKADDILIELNKELFELEQKRTSHELAIAELDAMSEADKKFAEKNFEYYRAELKRLKLARENVAHAVQASEIEQNELQAVRSELGVEQADLDQKIAVGRASARQAEFNIATKKLELRSIKSNLNGTVLEVFVEEGEWVQSGQPIARVTSYDELIAEGFVPYGRYTAADIGKEVTLSLNDQIKVPNVESVVGKIKFVSPELSEDVAFKVRIAIEIDNSDRKLPINLPLVLND